ncbi:MAG: hypothetical protein AAFQ82_25940, partial [Myxococcota bacterium]
TNELMISIMREFGLGPSDWESEGQPGFGYYTAGRNSDRPDRDVIKSQIDYHSYLDDVHLPSRPPGSSLAYLTD